MSGVTDPTLGQSYGSVAPQLSAGGYAAMQNLLAQQYISQQPMSGAGVMPQQSHLPQAAMLPGGVASAQMPHAQPQVPLASLQGGIASGQTQVLHVLQGTATPAQVLSAQTQLPHTMGLPSGVTPSPIISQQTSASHHYAGTPVVGQQPSFVVGHGNTPIQHQITRTSSVSSMNLTAQQTVPQAGVTAGQQLLQQNVLPQTGGMTGLQLAQQNALARQLQYPNVPMGQNYLPQTVAHHDPNLGTSALQGQQAVELLQQTQPALVQATDDATKVATVLASKPHLQSDLSRTPSPGEQATPKSTQPLGASSVQSHQQTPSGIAQQHAAVGQTAQQSLNQVVTPQPHLATSQQPQQQIAEGATQVSSVNAAYVSGVTGMEPVTTKPPVAPQVKHVMTADARPRAGSEPKTVHHGTNREDSPSKTPRPEQTQGVPHRLHTALDPHVKRTQSLKERTLSVASQDGTPNQLTPHASPKPLRRQTVDGTQQGIQQAVQQFHGFHTPNPVVPHHQIQQALGITPIAPTVGQLSGNGSAVVQSGVLVGNVQGHTDAVGITPVRGSPYILPQQVAPVSGQCIQPQGQGMVQPFQAPQGQPSTQSIQSQGQAPT